MDLSMDVNHNALLDLHKFASRSPSYVFNTLKQSGILKYRGGLREMEATLQYIRTENCRTELFERISKLWKTEARGDRRANKQ